MDKEVCCGQINYFKPGSIGKKWHKKWAVLYRQSPHGQKRLELFDSEDHFDKRNQINRKHVTVINLRNCSRLYDDKMNDGKKMEYVIKLNFSSDEKQQIFSCDEREVLTEWLEVIRSVVENRNQITDASKVFDVNIQSTELSDKLNLRGSYFLTVSDDDIALLAKPSKALRYKWPLHLLRKYGRNTQEFSLEAGRRCASGPGMFCFQTNQYNEIFQEVENRVKTRASGRESRYENATTSSSCSPRLGISKPFHVKTILPSTNHPARNKPSSPIPASPSSAYENPLDAKVNRNATENEHLYAEPVDIKPPTAKPLVVSRTTDKKDLSKPNRDNTGKKAREPHKANSKSSSRWPAVVQEATYCEPIQNDQETLADEYGHLNIAGVTVADAEYDSFSYPNQFNHGFASNEDTTYASTGSLPERDETSQPSDDLVYDRVQR